MNSFGMVLYTGFEKRENVWLLVLPCGVLGTPAELRQYCELYLVE